MSRFNIEYPRALLLVVLVVVNLALVGALVTSSSALGPYNSGWDGGSELQAVAEDTSGEVRSVLSTDAYDSASAEGTTAVIAGPSQSYTASEVASIRSFVRRGGRLVVATDTNQTNSLLRELGVESRIGSGLLRDEQSYHNSPSLPVAGNVSTHPLTEGVSQLTLNHGTILGPAGGDILVNTSDLAYVDRNGNETLDDNESLGTRPVATAESLGSGTVVVASDASLFTNAMVDREDNRAFLANLLSSERVILDYSHGSPLPPLAYALVTLRNSPLLQFLLGSVAVGLVVLWGVWPSIGVSLSRGRDSTDEPTVQLSEAELRAFLQREHPEWDEQRRNRVITAIISQRQQDDSNG